MSPSCPREEALSRRHDGELKGPDLAELEAHLATCPACREFAGKLRTLDALLTGPLAATSGAVRDKKGRRRTTVWFAAASLIALLASFLVATRVEHRPVDPELGVVTVTEAKDTVVLAFRIKITVPEAGKTKTMEIAPKVVVRADQDAQITVDTPEKTRMSIKARPHLTGKRAVELALTVTAKLGGTNVERQVRLVTLLGSPALIEFNDDRKGETLTIEVTPTLADR